MTELNGLMVPIEIDRGWQTNGECCVIARLQQSSICYESAAEKS